MIISQFIKAHIHTVPLEGILQRDNTGNKNTPIFEKNYKEIYSNNFNTKEVKLAGALTGKISNLIALDCDTNNTLELFTNIDKNYPVIIKSVNKPSGGGTILYLYDNTLQIPNFKYYETENSIKLDFFSDSGFIYLPTENNYTKKPWTDNIIQYIKPLPISSKIVLKNLYSTTIKIEVNNINTKNYLHYLEPLVKDFVETKKYNTELFKILTPINFRNYSEYKQNQHLHPNKIKLGEGSIYLSQISSILGADESISHDLYTEALYTINNLWDNPMDEKRLLQTIIKPMLDKTVIINNECVWKYNSQWAKKVNSAVFYTKDNKLLECICDKFTNMYYIIHHDLKHIRQFDKLVNCKEYLETRTNQLIKKEALIQKIKTVEVFIKPNSKFGFTSSDKTKFNTFEQTKNLFILNNPESYKKDYKEPITILKFLQTLIREKETYNYILRFLKTKLQTFEYSPVVLEFVGVQGSGKDTFVKILRQIIGLDYIAKPDVDQFLEKYNYWLSHAFFTHLDEYSSQITNISSRNKVWAKIKTFTGAENVSQRAMFHDSTMITHKSTFIITDNKDPFKIEEYDRRIVYSITNSILKNVDWVIKEGGMAVVYNKIMCEVPDFCYYLATEIYSLDPNEYQHPIMSKDKAQSINNSHPENIIIQHLNSRNYLALKDLAEKLKVKPFGTHFKKNKVCTQELYILYLELMRQEYKDVTPLDKRNFHQALEFAGYTKYRSTELIEQNVVTLNYIKVKFY